MSTRQMRRLCLFALSLVILIGGALHGQVYRWDTAEKISDTVPEPYADFGDQILDYAALDGLDLYCACFERASLVSAHLMGSDLRRARFDMATLTNTYLSDAIVQWACFTSTTDSGFTAAQLYSTASYQNNDLTGIDLSSNDMSAWNFA
ncbi:MAG: pentapeptide repeat-containing protein, partial [Phycisphaerae bacterium]|nr:pentapeptide repeat-containing protein [Phycisphaerae bacterium]